jgi:transmembrane sensor
MDGNIEHELSHALIGKYLAGECSPEEAAAAQAWIQASPENGETYAALRRIWEDSQAAASTEEARQFVAGIDVDAAWSKVQARMQDRPQVHVPVELPLRTQPRRTPQGRLWYVVAATLVLSIGTYLIWRSQQGPAAPQLLQWASGETPLRDTLPDGSIVTLNAHSQLEFPAEFAGAATRAVRLQGEAFFDVQRNPSQPFVIRAGDAEVRVLGTQFNVKATAQAVAVSVTEGKVRFAAGPEASAPALELVAGKSATYAAATKALVQDSLPDANAAFWLTGELVFQDKPLSEVVAELGKRWQRPIQLANPAIGACRLTATFKRPSIESTVQMIANTFNLEVDQDETSITLSGAGCQ